LIARKLLAAGWGPARLLLCLGQITLAWSVVITVTVGLGRGMWGLLERIEAALLLGWAGMLPMSERTTA
jgi:hypothetical protein